MRDTLIEFFSSKTNGPEISLFGFWHIFYVLLIIVVVTALAFFWRKKTLEKKEEIVRIFGIILTVLYIGDFFIQPFYNNDNLIIDKFPFHICTLMCPLILFTMFSKNGSKVKTPVAVLSLVASLMYLTYPGSAIGDISAFSYRVIQTFLYHGVLFAYGFLSLSLEIVSIEYKKIYRELFFLIGIAIWAFIGNSLYSTPTHPYDWFFIAGITFPFVPKFLMPFAVVGSIFAMVNIIYLLYFWVQKWFKKPETK